MTAATRIVVRVERPAPPLTEADRVVPGPVAPGRAGGAPAGSAAQAEVSHGTPAPPATSAPRAVSAIVGVCLSAGQAADTRMGSQPAGLPAAPVPAGGGGNCGGGDGGNCGDAGGGNCGGGDGGNCGDAGGGDGAKSGGDGAPGGEPGTTSGAPGLAISSATRLSAAMMTEGSGPSPACVAELIRAPAVAASDWPDCRVAATGNDGDLVSARHRSSHSSVVPPQPLTNAMSTGRSGSEGPTSAALMES